jgi:hypothetical protein
VAFGKTLWKRIRAEIANRACSDGAKCVLKSYPKAPRRLPQILSVEDVARDPESPEYAERYRRLGYRKFTMPSLDNRFPDGYERYDNQKLENLQAAVLKLESGKTFDPIDANRAETRPMTGDKVSSFFHDQAKVPTIDDQKSIARQHLTRRMRTI